MENELRIPTEQAVSDLIALNKKIDESVVKVEGLIKSLNDYGINLSKGVNSAKELREAEQQIIKTEQELIDSRKKLIDDSKKYKELEDKTTKAYWDKILAQKELIAQAKKQAEAENTVIQSRQKAKQALIEETKAHAEAIKMNKEYDKATKQATQSTNSWGNALQSFQAKFNVTGNLIGNLGGNAIMGFISNVKQAFGDVVRETSKLDSLRATYKAIFSSNSDYIDSLREMSIMAEKNGTSIIKLKEQYIQFAAAAKGSSLEGKKSFDVFNSVTKSLSLMGKSGEQSDRVLLALTQMMSKGTVQAEELKTQMGDSLPGAINIMAKAVGTNVEGLMKMMKAGEVIASEVLPKFAKELEKAYGADTIDRIDTLPAKISRSETAFTNFTESLKASGVIGWWYDLKTAMWEVFTLGDSNIITESITAITDLSKAQIDLNNLNKPIEERKKIYEDMQNQYPAILANYELERDGLAKINAEINKITTGLIVKLGIQEQQEETDKKAKNYAESVASATKKEIEARRTLADLARTMVKEGVSYDKVINRQKSTLGQVKDALKFLSTARDFENTSGYVYKLYNSVLGLENAYADTRETLTELQDSQKKTKEMTDGMTKSINGQSYALIKRNDIMLSDLKLKAQTTENAKTELGQLDALIEKNSKYKDIVQKLNDYKTKIAKEYNILDKSGKNDPMKEDVKSTNNLIDSANKYIKTLKDVKAEEKGNLDNRKKANQIADEYFKTEMERYEQKLYVAETTEKTIDEIETNGLLKKLDSLRKYINEQRKLGNISEYEQLKALNDIDKKEEDLFNNKLWYANIEMEMALKLYNIKIKLSDEEKARLKELNQLRDRQNRSQYNKFEKELDFVNNASATYVLLNGRREEFIKKVNYQIKTTKEEIEVQKKLNSAYDSGALEKYIEGLEQLKTKMESVETVTADVFAEVLKTFDMITSVVEAYYDRQEKRMELSEKRQINIAKRQMKEQIALGKSSTEAQAEYELKLAKIQSESAYKKDMSAWKRAKREKDETMVRINLANSEAVMRTAADSGWYAAIGVAAAGTAALIVAGSQPLPDKPNEADYYWKGTMNHGGGDAVVNDRGLGREMVIEPSGRSYIPFGDDVFIPNLPKGSMVIPADITRDIVGNNYSTSTVDISKVENYLAKMSSKQGVTLGVNAKKLGVFTLETQRINNRINYLKGKR